MANIIGVDYVKIPLWRCPDCMRVKLNISVGIRQGSTVGYPKYIHCNTGCGSYFDLSGKNITSIIER